MDSARGLARRNESVRARILQQVVLAALVLNPTPPEVVERIGQVARFEPAVLSAHDVRVERVVELGASAYGPLGRPDLHPISLGDTAR